MSFSLTPEEQNRVELASLLGYKLDPISHKDLALIITISAVYAVDLLAVIFLLANRRYPPLKSKNPLLMAAAFVSCVFWFIGDLQINGHVHLRNSILTDCRGIGVWLRVLLGVCTVSSLIALRSYGLFRVFRQNRSYRGFGFYLPFLVYCACTLVYGIVTQVLPARVTVEYMPMLDVCYCPKPFRAALYGYIWATWLIIALINWQIRNIKSSFNESREMLFSCLLVFAILTFSTALQFSRPEYPLDQTLRLLSTGMDHLGTNLVWWAIMGVPLFNCVFNRRKYLEQWTAKLRKDGLQHEYDVKSDSLATSSRLSAGSEDDDGFFLFDHAPDQQPVYLPNGEPRPISRKQQLQRQNRQSSQTTRTQASARTPNPSDPFDIPPMSPATTVVTQVLNDPFERNNTQFAAALHGVTADSHYVARARPLPAVANDSLTVLPRFSPATSHSSITPVYHV